MLFREHNHSYIITPLSRRRFIPHLPRPADYTSYKNHHCNNHFSKIIIAIIILRILCLIILIVSEIFIVKIIKRT